MSPETVSKTWRRLMANNTNTNDDEIIRRLDALEAWAKSRIIACDKAIEKHDGTLRVGGKVDATYGHDHHVSRIDQGERIRAGAEKQALEVVLRMLNGQLEAP